MLNIIVIMRIRIRILIKGLRGMSDSLGFLVTENASFETLLRAITNICFSRIVESLIKSSA